MIDLYKIYVSISIIIFSELSFARVYLEKEVGTNLKECEPRIFCSVLEDFFITEPTLVQALLKEIARDEKLLDIEESSIGLDLGFSINSTYNSGNQSSYFLLDNGLTLQSDFKSKEWLNTWSLNGTFDPFKKFFNGNKP